MNPLIKNIRNALGMTQKRFAASVGVQSSCISNYETGFRHPRPKIAQRIVDFAISRGVKAKLEDVYPPEQ